jgi:CHAT domain-containing protein
VTVTPVSVPVLQQSLSQDETLVEYYAAGGVLSAFVLSRDRIDAVRLEWNDLPVTVQEFRRALEDPGSERCLELAKQLFVQLVRPLEPFLQTPHLVIVPHGLLHYLPFGALHDDTQYLVDRYSLRYLPSASVTGYLKPPAALAAARVMVIANPTREERTPLVHAEHEAGMVAKVFPDATVLLRHDATETAFKDQGRRFNCLHLATHGVFNAASPLASGLLLAKDADNDGLLTVEELYSLTLDADLVTLSACETGLSKISNGDDLVGLARGFLYAGARSIIASLWSVDDEATAHLMSAFYANLASMNRRDALRAAQRATRQRYPHPFYWAAFQLTGGA